MSQIINEKTIHKTNSESVSSISSQDSQPKVTLEINTTESIDTSEETTVVSPIHNIARQMCYLPSRSSPEIMDISGIYYNEKTALQ